MYKPGCRVGVIFGSDEKVVEFLGYGVYEGDFVPENAVGAIAEMAKRYTGHGNPRIRLDNGKVVWGCECWWGSEEAVNKKIEQMKAGGYEIKEVDIDEIRAAYEGP